MTRVAIEIRKDMFDALVDDAHWQKKDLQDYIVKAIAFYLREQKMVTDGDNGEEYHARSAGDKYYWDVMLNNAKEYYQACDRLGINP